MSGSETVIICHCLQHAFIETHAASDILRQHRFESDRRQFVFTLNRAGLFHFRQAILNRLRVIRDALEASGGRLPFDDSTAPEAIRAKFGVSKKAFKQALGALYKARRIQFTNPGISRAAVRSADDK